MPKIQISLEGDGVYVVNYVDPPMPYGPSDLPAGQLYHLDGLLGGGAPEEVAARILRRCRANGRWIAVPVSDLFREIQEEHKEYCQGAEGAIAFNEEEEQRYENEMTVFWVLVLFTLGLFYPLTRLYSRWRGRPAWPRPPQVQVVPRTTTPRISLPWQGTRMLDGALRELEEREFAYVTKDGDSYLCCLLPGLVERLLR